MNWKKIRDRVGRLRWSHAAFILLAMFVVANWQLIAGRAYERWDAYGLGAPSYSLLGDFARAGRFLYWNPWIAGGSPDFAVAGSGAFSPDLLLFAVVTGMGAKAFLVLWMLIWLSGGIGMLLLARHLRAPVWGGLAVALGFLFSGFYTGHAQHTSVLYSYSLLPFILWRFDRALLEQKFLPAAQAGVLCGFSGLGGYPELTACTFALLSVWSLGRIFFARGHERTRDPQRSLLLGLTSVALGLLVLAPSYFSLLYEGAGYSDRHEPVTRAFALQSNALHPGALATLGSPALINFKLLQRSLWPYTDVSSANLYTGGVTLLFALLGLTSGRQRRWRWFLGTLVVIAFACAISTALPLRGWLYDLIPMTRYFRHASMLRGPALFLVSILALFGARDLVTWQTDSTIARRLNFFAPLLAVMAASAFLAVVATAKTQLREPIFAGAHFLILWGSLIFTALALKSKRDPAFLPFAIIAVASVDGLSASHFAEGTMYSIGTRPALPLPAEHVINPGIAGFRRVLGTGENINLYFKVAALRSYAPFANRYHEAIAKDPMLREMALGQDRLWFAPEAPEVPMNQDSFEQFARRVAELRAPIIFRHARGEMLHDHHSLGDFAALSKISAATNLPAQILEYTPDKLILNAVAPRDGWLMVTERWSRSWRAKVNGRPRPVECADFIFRAVPVTRGLNRIEFAFHPFAMPGLLIVSWSVAGFVGALTLARIFRRRASPAPDFAIAPDAIRIVAT